MITLRTTVAAFVVGALGFASAAIGQVQEDAKAVLTKSAEAVKSLKDASGTAHYHATGPLLGGMLNTKGDFKFIRGNDQGHSPAFLKGSAKTVANPNEEVFHVSLAVDGTQRIVTWVDDHAKVVYTRPLVARTDAFNQLTKGQQILMGELFAPEPFRKELNAQTLTLEPDADFDGEPCKVVKATYKEGETWAVWYISKNDNLPRKSDTGIKMAGHEEPVHVLFEMTNFKANQGLTAKDLAIAVPSDYRKDEQLATQPVTPGAEPVNVPPPPTLGPDRAAGAPEFDLKTPEGTAVSLNSLRGNVVVLAFWDVRNGMSVRALPVLETIHKDFAGKPVKVFAASCREKDKQAPVDMMKEKGATYGLLLGGDEVATAYKVRGFPSFVVINTDGNVAEFIQGFRGEDDLKQRLTTAINAALESK